MPDTIRQPSHKNICVWQYSSSLMPISELVTVERVTNLHKMILSLTKHNFHFANIFETTGRVLRNNGDIYIPNPHARSTTNTAALTLACTEYNNLDIAVRRLTSIKTFKSIVKLQILEKSVDFHPMSPYHFLN